MSRREKYLMIVCLSMIEAFLLVDLLTPSLMPHSMELARAVVAFSENPTKENQQTMDTIKRRLRREALPYEVAERGAVALLAAGNLWAMVTLVKKRTVVNETGN